MGCGKKSTRVSVDGLPPNGGFGWMVVLAAGLTRLFLYGITMTTGVMYDVFLIEFGEGKGDTAWISSLITAVGFLGCPVSGVLTDILGPRPVVVAAGLIASVGLCLSAVAPNIEFLIVSYGIITGLGYGILYVPISVAVASYFTSKRNIAMGLAAAGGGCGSLIFPPILRALVNFYDWNGCLLICGGLSLNVCACGLLFRPLSQQKEPPKADKNKEIEEARETVRQRTHKMFLSIFRMFRYPSYLILWLNNLLYIFGVSVVYVHLATLAKVNAGLSEDTAAMLYSVLGVSLVVAKLIQGFLAHKINEYVLYCISFTVGGVATLLVPLMTSFAAMVAYCLVFGVGVAAHGGALIPGMLVRMMGLEKLSLAYGALFIPAGIGQMFGGPVAGWLFESSKSYDVPFYTAGSVMVFAGLIMIIPWKCFQDHVDESEPEEVSNLKNMSSLMDIRDLGSLLSVNGVQSTTGLAGVTKKNCLVTNGDMPDGEFSDVAVTSD